MRTPRTDAPSVLLTDFDILDVTLSDPHARLAELPETTPVAYCPLYEGYWIVTRYEDIRAAPLPGATTGRSEASTNYPSASPLPEDRMD